MAKQTTATERFLTITEIYCENPHCNVRRCECVTKNHGDVPDPKTWRCPACGSPAKVHWQRDPDEHNREKLKAAVSRVNVHLYHREHPEDLSIPYGILMLDRAPDSWKSTKR